MLLIIRLGNQNSTTRLRDHDRIILVDTPGVSTDVASRLARQSPEINGDTTDKDNRIKYNHPPRMNDTIDNDMKEILRLRHKVDRLLSSPTWDSRDRRLHIQSHQKLRGRFKGPSPTTILCSHRRYRQHLFTDNERRGLRQRSPRMRNSLAHHMVRHRARSRNTGESWHPSLLQPG